MIRCGALKDLPAVLAIYERAREFMRQSGNPSQWVNGYPSKKIIEADIAGANFYVEECDGIITGCFAFIIGEEPTYQNIDGNWLDNAPYGTIHRLASDGTRKGFADRCIEFCRAQCSNLRADTHRDNAGMQRALLRNGFRYCGIIRVADGTPRLAFQSPF